MDQSTFLPENLVRINSHYYKKLDEVVAAWQENLPEKLGTIAISSGLKTVVMKRLETGYDQLVTELNQRLKPHLDRYFDKYQRIYKSASYRERISFHQPTISKMDHYLKDVDKQALLIFRNYARIVFPDFKIFVPPQTL